MSSAASPGHSISKADIVLIIDLDETLLSINSFPLWAKYFLFKKFSSLNYGQRGILKLKAAKIFAQRKMLRHDHATTKTALQKLWLEAGDEIALANILSGLEQKIRPNMRGVIRLISSGEIDALLATAAASQYARPFARNTGFTHVTATDIGEKENRGEEKSRSTIEFLEKQGWLGRKKIFFTDHLEDMPFILKSDKLMWFGKPEEIQTIKQSAPGLNIVACKDLSEAEIMNEIK